mgnify:CR=1 FL=1
MTLEETYRAGRRELMEAGIESPAFDAVCIFEKYFGLDRQGLILRGREEAGEEATLELSLIHISEPTRPY